MRQPADAMHIKCVHELYSMVPQHQFVRKMRHLSRDGGQAVRVRDLHRAGAHDQQHHYVDKMHIFIMLDFCQAQFQFKLKASYKKGKK